MALIKIAQQMGLWMNGNQAICRLNINCKLTHKKLLKESFRA
jgi:hypothetical protein